MWQLTFIVSLTLSVISALGMNSSSCSSSEALALFIIHCLAHLRQSLPCQSSIYITTIKGASGEIRKEALFKIWGMIWARLNQTWKWDVASFLILLGFVYNLRDCNTHSWTHSSRKLLLLTGPRCGAWELDASLCVFVNPWEMALGWVQAVCLCAYCSLSAWGGPALSPY